MGCKSIRAEIGAGVSNDGLTRFRSFDSVTGSGGFALDPSLPSIMQAMMPARSAVPLLILLATAFNFAPGCAPRADHPSPPVEVLATMLPPSEKPFWEPIARRFEEVHPGVRVDLVEGPQSTDLRENLYTVALLAKDPSFDLIYMDVTWVSKFAAAGWLLPLDELLADTLRSRLLPAALAAGIYRGRLYRLPVRTDIGLLFYRSDWLDGAGFEPPRSFDDLARIARSLQSPPERWGFVWQGMQYEGLVCNFLEVLHGFGGFWIDPESYDVGLDRPEAIRALEYLARCRSVDPISPPGVTTYQEETSRRLFQDGRAVFLRNWPYTWRLAQAQGSPLRGRVGARTMVCAVGGRPSGTLGGWGFGISAYSRRTALALEFARFAASLESQRILCAPTGYAPVLAAAYEDSVLLAQNPFLAQIESAHADAVIRPAIPQYALASDILQRHVSAALSGGDTPERALAAAARETRAVLGDGGAAGSAQGRGR